MPGTVDEPAATVGLVLNQGCDRDQRHLTVNALFRGQLAKRPPANQIIEKSANTAPNLDDSGQIFGFASVHYAANLAANLFVEIKSI